MAQDHNAGCCREETPDRNEDFPIGDVGYGGSYENDGTEHEYRAL